MSISVVSYFCQIRFSNRPVILGTNVTSANVKFYRDASVYFTRLKVQNKAASTRSGDTLLLRSVARSQRQKSSSGRGAKH